MDKDLKELQAHYAMKEIANKYMNRRMTYPIGRFRHEKQVRVINKVVYEHNVKHLLEIASGPGRLTREVSVECGLAIDSSEEMLKLGRRYVPSANWIFRAGNALKLDTGERFDMAMSFRFVWHLSRDQRLELYTAVLRNLKKKGLWLFDVILDRPLYLGTVKPRSDPQIPVFTYKNRKQLAEELAVGGFEILRYYPYLNHSNIQHIIGRICNCRTMKSGIFLIKLLDYIPPRFSQEGVVLCRQK